MQQELLERCCDMRKQTTRKDIAYILDCFNEFEKNGIKYCVLRNADEIISGDLHDVDIAVDLKHSDQILKIIRRNGWRVVYSVWRDFGNVWTVVTSADEGEYLAHFDFQSYGWDGINLLSAETLLEDRQKIDGIYVASEPVQAVTMLFSRYLYHGYIKEKYRKFIHSIYQSKQHEVKKLMRFFLTTEFVNAIYEDVVSEERENIERECPVVRRTIRQVKKKSQKGRISKSIFYITRMTDPCGIILDVSQLDEPDYNHLKDVLPQQLNHLFTRDELSENAGGGIRTAMQGSLYNNKMCSQNAA
ncbi:MAG: hypothetical protein LUG61_04630 [Lachnospiraceae bacterium]|nr:hypothetical protein [Lachnospiraceae bacterium]